MAVLAISGNVCSCNKDDAQLPVTPSEISIGASRQSLPKDDGQIFILVKASSAWTLEFTDKIDWARLSQNSGVGNKADVILEYDSNTGGGQRCFTLSLKSGSEEKTLDFVQDAAESLPDTGERCAWMELPATEDPSLSFVSRMMNLDGKTYRNYSFYWDKKALVAHWVAYPLNSTLLKGNSGRTDAWDYDPLVPEVNQPVLYSGYSGGSYDRGHQIPSADRQVSVYNMTTFYFTNMTPQASSLNQGAWGNLENYVRTKCRLVDTLYVVTGCVVEDGGKTVADNVGQRVSVPAAYYKALLAYKQSKTIGITGRTGGYTGIAFYYKNANYSGSFFNASMTIDELEDITGEDFFVNLPVSAGTANAETVESTFDKWWNQ